MAGVMFTLMTPAKAHISLLELLSRGFPPTRTVGAPGTQTPAGVKVQGMGVRTPRAAAVAEATKGLAREEHMPKVGSVVSEMVAIGILQARAWLWLVTVSGQGATPKLHMHRAVFTTGFAMFLIPFRAPAGLSDFGQLEGNCLFFSSLHSKFLFHIALACMDIGGHLSRALQRREEAARLVCHIPADGPEGGPPLVGLGQYLFL